MQSIKIINKNKEWLVLFVILALVAFLRFYDIGYSDFIPDETTVMTPIKANTNVFSKEFMLSQNKGPLQFWLARFFSLFVKSPFNAFSYRLPFAFANILAFLFLYLYVKSLSNSKIAGLFVVLLFGLNGFTVAFGRIVQYQSLNMLFSILALYLYRKYQLTNVFKYSVFGTLALVLSFLAHWDVFFVLPIAMYHLFFSDNPKHVGSLNNEKFSPKERSFFTQNKKHLLINIILGLVLVFAFLIPYYNYTKNDASSITYLNSRVGVQSNFSVKTILDKAIYYKFFTELYNPFVYIYLFVVLSLVSVFSAKNFPYHFGWYLLVIFIFFVFVKRSGTHLYNVFLPFSIISGLTLGEISLRINKYFKLFLILMFLPIFVFLWFQNYLIFNEYSNEYPWERENFFNDYQTQKYSQKNLTNNIVGFPISRKWHAIRDFVHEYMKSDLDSFTNGNILSQYTYLTNDSTSTAGFYLDLQPGLSSKTFVIGVKTPQTFANDYKFSKIKGKRTLHKVRGNDDTTVAQIYLYLDEKFIVR